jgi:hypothetical protein
VTSYTISGLLKGRETVAVDTPAVRATCCIVDIVGLM